jgi:hypothetical protein
MKIPPTRLLKEEVLKGPLGKRGIEGNLKPFLILKE